MKRKTVLSFPVAFLFAAPAFAQQICLLFNRRQLRCRHDHLPGGLAPGSIARQTSVRGINAGGDIVGFYVDSVGTQHGFLLQDGLYTTIDFPLAGVRGTIANGINPRGEIVGQYVLPINADAPESSPFYCPPNLPNGNANAACIKGFY